MAIIYPPVILPWKNEERTLEPIVYFYGINGFDTIWRLPRLTPLCVKKIINHLFLPHC